MGRFKSVGIIVLISFLIWGCRTTKPIADASIVPVLTNRQLLDSVRLHSDFDLLSARIMVNYTTEKESKSFVVRARIKKDSIIWLSVAPAMGIELFRLCITQDSVKMLNRLDQQYFSNVYSEAEALLKLDADFKFIQSAFLGSFLDLYDDDDYRSVRNAGGYRLITDDEKMGSAPADGKIGRQIQQETDIEANNWKITRSMLFNAAKQEQYIAEYSDFEVVDNLIFPTLMNFKLDTKEKMVIDLKWSKLEQKTTMRFPFNIPDKYASIK